MIGLMIFLAAAGAGREYHWAGAVCRIGRAGEVAVKRSDGAGIEALQIGIRTKRGRVMLQSQGRIEREGSRGTTLFYRIRFGSAELVTVVQPAGDAVSVRYTVDGADVEEAAVVWMLPGWWRGKQVWLWPQSVWRVGERAPEGLLVGRVCGGGVPPLCVDLGAPRRLEVKGRRTGWQMWAWQDAPRGRAQGEVKIVVRDRRAYPQWPELSSQGRLGIRSVKLPRRVWQWRRAEMEISLTGRYSSPFDPKQIAVSVTFTGPDGRSFELPAFADVPFKELRLGNWSFLIPAGRQTWRARFALPLEGRWRVRVTARDQSGARATWGGAVEAIGRDCPWVGLSRSWRGFVRASGGELRDFYPIGLDASGLPFSRERAWRALDVARQAGANWISLPAPPLPKDAGGVRDAADVDRLMETARRLGIAVELALPAEEAAIRYAVARWAAEEALFGWRVSSGAMSKVRRIDGLGRLVGGPAGLRGVRYVVGRIAGQAAQRPSARNQAVRLAPGAGRVLARSTESAGVPAIFVATGGSRREMHVQLWEACMAGVAGLAVEAGGDEADAVAELRALSEFLRGVPWAWARPKPGSIAYSPAGQLVARCLRSQRLVLAWVRTRTFGRPVRNCSLTASGLGRGTYFLTIYSPWEGRFLARKFVRPIDGRITVRLREIRYDVALRLQAVPQLE